MRRDKTAARILLVLSVVHVAIAAPAIVRLRSLRVVKDVTPGLEKRGDSDDESSRPFQWMVYDPSHTPETPPLQDGVPPTPGTAQSLDDAQPASGTPPQEVLSGTPQLHDDPVRTPGAPPSPDDPPPGSGSLQSQLQDDLPPTLGTPQSHDDPSSASGTLPFHDDPQPRPGTPPSQDDTSSALGDPEEHSEPPEDLQLHDDPSPWWQHTNRRPPGEMLQGELPPTAGAPSSSSDIPPLHDYLSWQDADWRPSDEMLQGESSGVPQLPNDPWWLHTNWHPPGEMLQGESSEVPQFQVPSLSQHTDSRLGETLRGVSSGTSGGPQFQNDLPPASGTPRVHNDGPGEFDNSYRWHNDFRVIEGASLSSGFDPPDAPMPVESPPLESEAALPAPEAHPFFNDELKQKLKTIGKFGAVAGTSAVLTLGIQKLIKDHSHGSHGTYVSAFFPPSLADL